MSEGNAVTPFIFSIEENGQEGTLDCDLNMNALSNYSSSGERELNAFLAGNDILLCPDNIFEAINLIKDAIQSNPALMIQLNESCRKILMLKKWVGAFDSDHISSLNLTNKKSILLNRNLSKHAITVLKNKNNIIPLTELESSKIAYLSMGNDSGAIFYDRLNNYMPIEKYTYSLELDKQHSLLQQLKLYTVVKTR